MRGLRSTLVLLVILIGLGAYIYFVESKREPAPESGEPKAKVFANLESDKIEELKITGSAGEAATLKKANDTWQLVEPVTVRADQTEVTSLASSLASLEIQRVVEEEAPDLAKYGLAPPRIDISFKPVGGTAYKRILIGDKTATGGDLYAKLADDKRVFLIPAYLETTFDRKPFDLRDKDVLAFERDKADTLEIVTAAGSWQAAKAESAWRLQQPWQAPADFSGIEGLVTRLDTVQMKSLVAEQAADLKRYGLDKPVASATVGAGSARATLAIGGAAEEGTLYARDLSRGLIFTVESGILDELKKAPAEFRRKDVFEFRPFSANRIEIARGTQTVAFEKSKASASDAEEKWRQVAPAAREIDATKMEAVLSKLSNLRAQSFADPGTRTGIAAPAATVSVRFDEGKKQERAAFGQVGDAVYAAIGDQAPPAKLDATEFTEALKAVDELVK